MEPLNKNQRNEESINLSDGIGMEPLSRNQSNGEGLNLSEGIGVEPLSRDQSIGEGLNLSEGIGMEPLSMDQRNKEGLNSSEGIGMEALSRNQRNGEGMSLSDEISMEPLSRNQRNGERMNLSDGIGMEPLSRNQRNGEGLNLGDEIGIEPLYWNQRNWEGMNLSDVIWMDPLSRNQSNGEGMNLSDEILMESLSRNQRNGEGMNLSDEIWMEPLSRNERNWEGMNSSDGIGIESLSRNERNEEGLNLSDGIEMEPLSRNQRNGEGLNLSEGRMKRVSGRVEGNSVVKKVRFVEEDDKILDSHNYIDENVSLEKVKVDVCQECGLLSVPEESHNVIQVLNGNLENANGGSELGFDLNIPLLEADDESSVVGLQEYTQRTIELNEIRSDESDRREERVNKGNGKQIEEIPYDAFGSFKLELGVMSKDQDIGGSSPLGSEKRYTREEKGKAKVDNSWLSLTTLLMESDLQHKQEEKEVVSTLPKLGSIQCRQNVDVSPIENVELRNNSTAENASRQAIALREQQEAVPTLPQLGFIQRRQNVDMLPIENVEVRKNLIAEHASRQAIALRERAPCFARYNAPHEGSSSQETKLPTLETIKDLGNTPDPFSTALKRIRERIPKRKDEKLVRWEASQHPGNKEFSCAIPSLLDLSLKSLAENAEAIVSLQGVPDILRRRLTELLCNSRKMSSHMLDLLVQGSPTQIRIKDCSWLTEKQFCNSFKDFDRRNLMVLQLDLCGQPTLDYVLGTTIAPTSNSLPNLVILSLRGACRMSDRALEILVTAAPFLQSIDLGQCSLLTHTSVDIVANSLGSILKELCIDDCQNIEAILILPALEKMEHLEVLSVAGIDSVCDQFVRELLTARGQNLKELDISGCENLTDQSLKFIGDTCANLHSLNISNLSKLTDVGLQFLANGCRSIRKLKFLRNSFSDEGIAAFLEASGACLEELSLNNCSKVSTITAFSLAKSSRKLLHLDLSWCRRLSDEELGLIVDSCLSLKLLKLFGCTQITDVFINGHSNTVVQIIGLSMTPVFDKINRFDGKEVLMKHSPIPTPSNS